MPDADDYDSYYYNTFEYNGVNAIIDYQNSYLYAFANYFYSNHDEFIYGQQGGQIDVDHDNNVTLASNGFDGGNAQGVVGSSTGPFGCTVPYVPGINNIGDSVFSVGIEAHSNGGTSGISLYNNNVQDHIGPGVGLDSAQTAVLLSTYDPNCVGCYVNSIGANGFHGIWAYGNTMASFVSDGLMSAYNGTAVGGYGIWVDNPSGGNTITFTFEDNSCLDGNASGRTNFGSNVTVYNYPSSDTCPTH